MGKDSQLRRATDRGMRLYERSARDETVGCRLRIFYVSKYAPLRIDGISDPCRDWQTSDNVEQWRNRASATHVLATMDFSGRIQRK